MASNPRPLDVGDTLGSYELLAPLGAGGMARLFLGRRAGAAGFAQRVAVKVVHPHLSRDPAFARMFVEEALLAVRIDSPNVVRVEELGERDGVYFLAMEYVHGVSLAVLLRALARQHRRLAVVLAVHVAIAVADGLHAAHTTRGERGEALGVVHRDVSPQNILLGYNGHIKLIDFGIAKARGRASSTQAGGLRGKLEYMPPEQARGATVDARTDVYALGVVLWEMLTMRRLFPADEGGAAALLARVQNPRVQPPGRFTDGVDAALDAAVMAALDPRPDGRPATAQEFRRRLAVAVPEASGLEASHLAQVLAAVVPEPDPRAATDLGGNASTAPLGTPGSASVTDPAVIETLVPREVSTLVPAPDAGHRDRPVAARRAVWAVALLALAALAALAVTSQTLGPWSARSRVAESSALTPAVRARAPDAPSTPPARQPAPAATPAPAPAPAIERVAPPAAAPGVAAPIATASASPTVGTARRSARPHAHRASRTRRRARAGELPLIDQPNY